jgi:hypothetical protein
MVAQHLHIDIHEKTKKSPGGKLVAIRCSDDFSGDLQYGFIAQEVKAVLPNSIRYSEEFGLSNFHTLDTDQIFKAEFGATQYLLQKLQEMEAQVSTLESRLKSPAA